MRIINWNCNQAFRKKSHKIIELEPDIVVVPEAENPEIKKDKSYLSYFSAYRWFGDNKIME